MARTAFQESDRLAAAKSVIDKLAEVRSSCLVIKAKIDELIALRALAVAGVPAGDYDQADVDRLDALTPKVAALRSAVLTYLG